MTPIYSSEDARELGRLTSEAKRRSSRQNLAKARLELVGKDRPWVRAPLRRIMRFEKIASANSWYEVLSCGHEGKYHIEKPKQLIPIRPAKRRCYECKKPK
jgi:hypothetical protein